jgi:phosphoribosylglycinamide formyltransferase 1
MANIAVFASGNGSNFEALATEFANDPDNRIKVLICNRKSAFAIQRAVKFGIECRLVNYISDGFEKTEERISSMLTEYGIDVIVLAGFMKILSAGFIDKSGIPIINIHPSLLPKHKGADAIKKAYESGDSETGITIHYVNELIDGGDIILQKSIPLEKDLPLEEIEKKIHVLEHKYYPEVTRNICNEINIKLKGYGK